MSNVAISEKLIKYPSKCRPGITRTKKWIVIHETGNPSNGAGADNHATYLSRLAEENNTYLSWHYTVDDKKIVRHIPDNEIAWHAGDGEKEGGGNYAGIGIEICINPESDYSLALENAASLTADLLKTHNLGLSAVKQHHDFSSYGKECPRIMRERGLWNDFLGTVGKYFKEVDTEGNFSAPKPALNGAYNIGDKAILSGYVYVDSYASKAGQKFSYKVCTVTKVADTSRPAPYLLDNGLGWAKANDLSGTGGKSKTLAVGSRVRVSGNLYTTSYGENPVRAINGNYIVTRIIKGRTAGVLLNTNFGWVKESDCTVI